MPLTLEDIDLYEQFWIEKSRKNFLAYRQFMRNDRFLSGWFMADLCKHLQQFYLDLRAGLRPILLIQSPPQHGKSWTVADFISWVSGKWPEIRTIYATYSDTLGVRCNLSQQRQIDSEKYNKIFPGTKLSSKKGEAIRNTNHLEFLDADANPTFGQFRNTTTGGSVTGESLDCVSEDTLIITDTGEIKIKDLIFKDSPVKVLSYNHNTMEVEFEEVTHIKKVERIGLLRITDIHGKFLVCTPDHKVYTANRGYIRADQLSTSKDCLFLLQKGGCKTRIRDEQMDKDKLQTRILLKSLPKQAYAYRQKGYKTLQGLWEKPAKAIRKTLPGLFKKGKIYINYQFKISTNNKKLLELWEKIQGCSSRARSLCNILLQKVFRKWTFRFNEWGWQLQLEGWNDRIERISPSYKRILPGKKRIFERPFKTLQTLRNIGKSSLSSYRRKSREQPYIKPHPSLRKTPQANTQKIKKIERINKSFNSYDITVKNNHNFFANGILVHNCGIIDDAVKGREAASSVVQSQKIWEWFTDDFMTRFSENAGLLIIMTRWSTHDIIARLLKIKDKFNSKPKVLNYQAIATKDEANRKEGEALFPELKSLEFLQGKKAVMAGSSWESLYQGNPTVTGGNLFKDDWWAWYTKLPLIKYKFITADTAQKVKTQNDWTIFQCWGYGIDGRIYLIDKFREKLEAPELRREAEMFYRKHNQPRINITDPVLRGMYIEDKSSGTGLLQELRRKRLKVIEVPRVKDKYFRGEDAAPYIESGRVVLSTEIPGVDNLTKEAREFPAGEFDDDIDTCMTAVEVAFINKDQSNMLKEAMEAD